MNNLSSNISLTFLRTLDTLRPLFRLRLDVVKHSVSIYHKLSGVDEITLQKFLTTEDNVRIFFPHCKAEADVLITYLREPSTNGEVYVCLLDILFVMTSMAIGTLQEKAKLFFEWFHTNGYEMMSDMELTLFILKFSKCLTKMKIIGRIDITQEDAEHEAFKARLCKDGSIRKAMSFDDFYEWLKERPEVKAFEKFRLQMDKLLILLGSLRNRTVNILDLLESKKDFTLKNSDVVPKLDVDERYNSYSNGFSSHGLQPEQLQSCCDKVYIMEKSTCHVSVYLPLATSYNYIENLYVKKEEIVPYEFITDLSVFPPPGEATKTERKCEQYMVFTSYQNQNIQQTDYSKVGVRIDVNKLKGNRRYVLTFYTENNFIYGKTEVTTLSVLPQSPLNTTTTSFAPIHNSDEVKTTKERSTTKLCIFPNTFCSDHIQEYFCRSPMLSVEKTALLVFTGSICEFTKSVPAKSVYPFTVFNTKGISPVNPVVDLYGGPSECSGIENVRNSLVASELEIVKEHEDEIEHEKENDSGFCMLLNPLNQEILAKSISAFVEKYLFHHWNDQIHHLYSTVSYPDIIKDGFLPSHSTICQLLYYPCNCLDHEIEALISLTIPVESFANEDNRHQFSLLLKKYIEKLYYSYSVPVHSSLRHSYSINNIKLFVVKQQSENKSTFGGMEVSDVLATIDQMMMKNDDIVDHVVIAISSPLDLLKDYNDDDNEDEETVHVVYQNDKGSANDTKASRGKWEILHGESSTNTVGSEAWKEWKNMSADKKLYRYSNSFPELVEKLFEWMENSPSSVYPSNLRQKSTNENGSSSLKRRCTIVSCGWIQGHNFTISRDNSSSKKHNKLSVGKVDDPFSCNIRHECLLPTAFPSTSSSPAPVPKAAQSSVSHFHPSSFLTKVLRQQQKMGSPAKAFSKKFSSMFSVASATTVQSYDVDHPFTKISAEIMKMMNAELEHLKQDEDGIGTNIEKCFSLKNDAVTDYTRVFSVVDDASNGSNGNNKLYNVVLTRASIISDGNNDNLNDAKAQDDSPRVPLYSVPSVIDRPSEANISEEYDVSISKLPNISSIGELKAQGKSIIDVNPKSITSAPQIIRGLQIDELTSQDVFLSAVARGGTGLDTNNFLVCTLYTMPMNINLSDAISILSTPEERELLRPIGRRKRRCFLVHRDQTVVFHFGDLRPFSAYAAVLEPSANELPLVSYFHTLPLLKHFFAPEDDYVEEGNPDENKEENELTPEQLEEEEEFNELISVHTKDREGECSGDPEDVPITVILASIGTQDLYLPSYRVRRVIQNYTESTRPLACSVFLINNSMYDININNGRRRGHDCESYNRAFAAYTKSFCDIDILQNQKQVGVVGRPLSDLEFEKKSDRVGNKQDFSFLSLKFISVEMYDSCVRIFPKYDCVEAVHEMSEAIFHVDKYHEDVTSILLIVNKPLVHFFCKNKDVYGGTQKKYRWGCKHACPLVTSSERTAYIKLFLIMFSWKLRYAALKSKYAIRDCYIVTVTSVKFPKCVLFSKQDAFEIIQQRSVRDYSESPMSRQVRVDSMTEEENDNSYFSQSSMENGPNVDAFSCGCIRHLILPSNWNEIAESNSYIFPPANVIHPFGLNSSIVYEIIDMPYDSFKFAFECASPRLDLHGHSLDGESEPVTYLFDILSRNEDESIEVDGDDDSDQIITKHPSRAAESHSSSSLEGNDVVFIQGCGTRDLNDEDNDNDIQSQTRMDSLDDASMKTYVTSGQFHLLICRTIMNDYDHFDFVLGPVIGFVTNTTAKILVEVNRNLKSLLITLRPRGIAGELVELRLPDIKAFELATFVFRDLRPGVRYDILVPEFRNDRKKTEKRDSKKEDVMGKNSGGNTSERVAKGSFRTKTDDCMFVQVAFTGDNCYANETELINFVVRQLNSQQGFNMDLLAVQKHIQTYLTMHENASSISSVSNNSWKWLNDHLNLPFSPSSQIIHLGNHALMPLIINRVTKAILKAASFLELPLDRASGVSSFFFQQFDEIMKDTFRLFATIPAMQMTFASGHHSPAYNMQYQLPFSLPLSMRSEHGKLNDIASIAENESIGLGSSVSGTKELNPFDARRQDTINAFINSGLHSASPQKLLMLTKKIFEGNMQSYLMTLIKEDLLPVEEVEEENSEPVPYQLNPDGTPVEAKKKKELVVVDTIDHYTKVWRYGTVVIIVFDIVSGRKKSKKRKKDRKLSNSISQVELPTIKGEKNSLDISSAVNKAVTAAGGATLSSQFSRNASMGGVHALKNKPLVEPQATINTATPSLGFLDKTQWNLLKNILKDISVTHLVLASEKPFVSLEKPPIRYTENLATDEGGIESSTVHEWCPIVNDLTLLCDDLIAWLLPGEGKPAVRNVALVGASNVPYTTTIRDVRTGMKIQQVCLGNFQFNEKNHKQKLENLYSLRSKIGEYTLVGGFGRYKYWHSFGQMREMLIDSSRGGEGGKDLVATETVKKSRVNSYFGSNTMFSQVRDLQSKHGFGLLKLWVDSWKSTGSWSFLDENTAITPPGDAILVVGPIMGVLYRKTTYSPGNISIEESVAVDSHVTGSITGDEADNIEKTETLWLPILYEFDRPTKVNFVLKNVFSAEEVKYSFHFIANRPMVVDIGPLESGSRYTLTTTSGVRNTHTAGCIISTDYNEHETNVAVLNCSKCRDPNVAPCADLLQDVVERCSIPFHGVSCILHVNVRIFSDNLLDELLDIPNLEESVVQSRLGGALSSECREILTVVMDTIRQDLRNVLSRPSYRQMLRTAFNMFMPTTTFEDSISVEESSNTQSLRRLLRLMVMRVSQEYLEQLRFPSENVFTLKKCKIILPEIVLDADGNISEIIAASTISSRPGTGVVPLSEMRPMSGVQPGKSSLLLNALGSSVSTTTVSGSEATEPPAAKVKPKSPILGLLGGGSIPSLSSFGPSSKPSTPTAKEIKEMMANKSKTKRSVSNDTDADAPVDMDKVEKPETYITDLSIPAVDAVYEQWLAGMEACPVDWKPFVSANNNTTVEVVRCPNDNNIATVFHQIDNCVIDKGTRILILDEGERQEPLKVFEETKLPKGKKSTSKPGTANSKYGSKPTTAGSKTSSVASTPTTSKTSTPTASRAGTTISNKIETAAEAAIAIAQGKKPVTTDFEVLFHEDSTIGFKFQKRLQKWLYNRPDRSIVLVCPSMKHGTAEKILSRVTGSSMCIYTVDSVFRSNRIVLEHMLREKERKIRDANASRSGGGSSKRVQQKRMEEENKRLELAKKEFEEFAKQQVPDGYLIVESRLDHIVIPESLRGGDEKKPKKVPGGGKEILEARVYKTEFVVSRGVAGLIHSKPVEDEQDEETDDSKLPVQDFFSKPPSQLDHVLMPAWLRKFSPGTDGVFIQDDVLLVMRQDSDTKAVVDKIEEDSIYFGIIQQYEKSRLSDLSRPADLREVDMSLPGVLEVFVKDIVERIWEEVVPSSLKPRMVNLCDDFIRSYCLSRTLSESGGGQGRKMDTKATGITALASAEVFARRIQKALVLATTLKTCFKMKDMEKFKYVLKYPEIKPFDISTVETTLLVMHGRKPQQWNDDGEEVKAEDAETKEEVESDIAELDQEELEFERKQQEEEEKREREEEEKERLANLPPEEKNEDDKSKAEDSDEDDFEFDEDGNPKKQIVAVKLREEEPEAPREDIVGVPKVEEVKEEKVGYPVLNDTELAQAAATIQASFTKHKVLVRRSLKERLVFLQAS